MSQIVVRKLQFNYVYIWLGGIWTFSWRQFIKKTQIPCPKINITIRWDIQQNENLAEAFGGWCHSQLPHPMVAGAVIERDVGCRSYNCSATNTKSTCTVQYVCGKTACTMGNSVWHCPVEDSCANYTRWMKGVRCLQLKHTQTDDLYVYTTLLVQGAQIYTSLHSPSLHSSHSPCIQTKYTTTHPWGCPPKCFHPASL